jgi:hypothetical protein
MMLHTLQPMLAQMEKFFRMAVVADEDMDDDEYETDPTRDGADDPIESAGESAELIETTSEAVDEPIVSACEVAEAEAPLKRPAAAKRAPRPKLAEEEGISVPKGKRARKQPLAPTLANEEGQSVPKEKRARKQPLAPTLANEEGQSVPKEKRARKQPLAPTLAKEGETSATAVAQKEKKARGKPRARKKDPPIQTSAAIVEVPVDDPVGDSTLHTSAAVSQDADFDLEEELTLLIDRQADERAPRSTLLRRRTSDASDVLPNKNNIQDTPDTLGALSDVESDAGDISGAITAECTAEESHRGMPDDERVSVDTVAHTHGGWVPPKVECSLRFDVRLSVWTPCEYVWIVCFGLFVVMLCIRGIRG